MIRGIVFRVRVRNISQKLVGIEFQFKLIFYSCSETYIMGGLCVFHKFLVFWKREYTFLKRRTAEFAELDGRRCRRVCNPEPIQPGLGDSQNQSHTAGEDLENSRSRQME